MANGVELATAYVSLAVEGSQIGPGVTRSLGGVERQAETVGRNSGKKMGSGISSGVLGSVARMAGPIAGIFAAIGVGKILSSSIDEALEAQKVSATTDAIIKSTGGVAKVSAKNVSDLSEALSKKIGVDDELIQSGANLLLTFKNVRNEVGKGNAVFDRATAAAQDLSAAGFGDAAGASKMLGKALNDPVRGITALSRAGVTFSDAQKKQIKDMVKSNDLLGAQKIILGEVESQVGGVAEATATTSDKVKVSWDNIKEQIGTALLPVLEKLGNWFLDEGLPAIQKFGGWVKDELWPALKEGYDTIMPGVTRALDILTGGVGDGEFSWKKLGDIITQKVIPFIAKLTNVYLPAWATQIRAVIEVVKAVGSFFNAQVRIVRAGTSVIIGAFIRVADVGAAMFDALSKVPGFGWAKDAANKLRDLSAKAREVRDAINGIPKERRIKIIAQVSMPGRITLPGGEKVNIGLREHGGPVTKGQPYIVGEKRPELFVPNTSGKILPRVPESPAGTGSGHGLDLSEASLRRLGTILGGVTVRGQISAGSVDSAMAVNL